MIKGVFGIHKLTRWFRCVIRDRHEDIKLPLPPSYGGKYPVKIYKCRYCGRTLCDYD
jgi:hypothetical protein